MLAERAGTPRVAPRTVAAVQAAYYLAAGAWPLVSMRTFEAVSGRKRDRWLVRTVGLLSMAFGATLARRAAEPSGDDRAQADRGGAAAGLAPALAFGVASLWYWGRGTVNAAYLLDAAAEAAFVGAWLGLARTRILD